jgi:hypothetical protein
MHCVASLVATLPTCQSKSLQPPPASSWRCRAPYWCLLIMMPLWSMRDRMAREGALPDLYRGKGKTGTIEACTRQHGRQRKRAPGSVWLARESSTRAEQVTMSLGTICVPSSSPSTLQPTSSMQSVGSALSAVAASNACAVLRPVRARMQGRGPQPSGASRGSQSCTRVPCLQARAATLNTPSGASIQTAAPVTCISVDGGWRGCKRNCQVSLCPLATPACRHCMHADDRPRPITEAFTQVTMNARAEEKEPKEAAHRSR